jgi:hypothetical protein
MIIECSSLWKLHATALIVDLIKCQVIAGVTPISVRSCGNILYNSRGPRELLHGEEKILQLQHCWLVAFYYLTIFCSMFL